MIWHSISSRFNNYQKNAPGAILFSVIFAHKFFYTACRVDQFLFSGIKRMTGRTNFNLHIANNRANLKRITASTANRAYFVFRVDTFFHFYLLAVNFERSNII